MQRRSSKAEPRRRPFFHRPQDCTRRARCFKLVSTVPPAVRLPEAVAERRSMRPRLARVPVWLAGRTQAKTLRQRH
ncbi:conserved hypothetical protein [Ricinus communis]|uniref:Uncharacterized protein n=1 Tax=Ricinus communis TaxID=3988 RepID=B9TDE9_RICCO|nr:conserved hypothetical protein [Ricinus communis]